MTLKPKIFLSSEAAGLRFSKMMLLINKYMERQCLSAVQLMRVVGEDAAHPKNALSEIGHERKVSVFNTCIHIYFFWGGGGEWKHLIIHL